jgi:hypothetical protein
MRRGGRAALCGAVSEYGADTSRPGPANLFRVGRTIGKTLVRI